MHLVTERSMVRFGTPIEVRQSCTDDCPNHGNGDTVWYLVTIPPDPYSDSPGPRGSPLGVQRPLARRLRRVNDRHRQELLRSSEELLRLSAAYATAKLAFANAIAQRVGETDEEIAHVTAYTVPMIRAVLRSI